MPDLLGTPTLPSHLLSFLRIDLFLADTFESDFSLFIH